MSRDRSLGHVTRNVKNERAPVHRGVCSTRALFPPPVISLLESTCFFSRTRSQAFSIQRLLGWTETLFAEAAILLGLRRAEYQESPPNRPGPIPKTKRALCKEALKTSQTTKMSASGSLLVWVGGLDS